MTATAYSSEDGMKRRSKLKTRPKKVSLMHCRLPWKSTSHLKDDGQYSMTGSHLAEGILPAFATKTWRSWQQAALEDTDRKSTRLNSSHLVISYAVFCLK